MKFLKFPSLSYGYQLLNALNFTKTANYIQDYLLIQKSLLKINVYYDTIEYDLLTESPQVIFLNISLNIAYAFSLIFGIINILFKILFILRY